MGHPAMTRTAGKDGQAPVVKSSNASIQLSDEQTAVVDARLSQSVIIVNAFAGTGKTTTAQAFAASLPQSRFLYLCLGRANAEEARQRFGSNVTAKTTHAIALQAMAPKLGGTSRIEGSSRPWRPKSILEELRLRSYTDAALTQKILAKFFGSSDPVILAEHALSIESEFPASEGDLSRNLSNAQDAWRKMTNPSENTTIPHDAYLKMFALDAPVLRYDWIIFDEAQDANPVTASIIRAQAASGQSKVLCIGDRHQSIFGFRGAIDAMSDFATLPQARLINLTKTWRFGEAIAADATTLLHDLKGETAKIIGMGQAGTWNPKKFTLLSRTNAQLFQEAAQRNGKGIHWVGGVEKYRVSMLEDAYALYSRKKTAIRDPFIRNFFSWDQFVRYGENARDPETRMLVSLVETHGPKVPSIVSNILNGAVADPANASITMTTAHKSKGLDWDSVRLAEDFCALSDAEKALVDDPGNPLPEKIAQEINLMYVGMTRAKKSMDLNVETKVWFEKLPQHQEARKAARESLNKITNRPGGH